MAAAFSSNAVETLSKLIQISTRSQLNDEEIELYYEIPKCIDFIQRNSYKQVALQFPDDLLLHSFRVSKLIEEKTPEAKIYILGDTSYGSCCVDEVAAEHIKADSIIHFGRACLSPTKRLPVLYIFGTHSIDVEDCHSKYIEMISDLSSNVILFHDVIYQHSIDKLYDKLKGSYQNLIFARLIEDNRENDSRDICDKCGGQKTKRPDLKTVSKCCGSKCGNADDFDCNRISNLSIKHQCTCTTTQEKLDEENSASIEDKTKEQCQPLEGRQLSIFNRFGRSFTLNDNTKIDDYIMFFIGKESSLLTNLIMTYNKNKFYTYDPDGKSARKEELNVNKALMKRYYLIQKAKEAQTVGIVAGTLGVADYLVIIDRLKRLLKQAGKKYYTFMMGKPNVPKMANFMEVDIFVLVACPENSLIDSQDFYKPIITPFEMEIACSRARDWTGEYITDFRELLPGAASHVDFEETRRDDLDSEPEFSLISGSLIRMQEDTVSNITGSTEIVQRNSETSLSTFGSNSAAHFLHSRTWQGLEKKFGETEVCTAVEGRKGVSTGYSHELEQND